MSLSRYFEDAELNRSRGARSHSAQGLATTISSPAMKIPLPPRMWITDIEDESSDEIDGSLKDEGVIVERPRVRSRFRHHKTRSTSMPIGIFWDIENCQVPRGCSAIDVVSAIRAKFLPGRREADFVVVCDVRKEASNRLQELNDAQVSLIHVCCTQKNAADEKLRQCMRRFGELHSAPAALLLISGDINFAADLSDFRYRKNMEVILVHKQNTSTALIACASSHYCYYQLTADLPRNPKSLSQSHEDEEDPTCEMEVCNLPLDQTPDRVSKRLRRLADNCGGKVLRINLTMATLRFPTPDHASRALKRMDGEDVFGRKISTRYARNSLQPTYSSDEGYSTAPAAVHHQQPSFQQPSVQQPSIHQPSVQQPSVQQTSVQQPSVHQTSILQPSLQQPSVQQPSFQHPSFQQPTFQKPTFQQPTVQQPNFRQPTVQQPTVQQPTFQQPTYQQPTYQQPTYQPPTFQQPIFQPPSNQLVSEPGGGCGGAAEWVRALQQLPAPTPPPLDFCPPPAPKPRKIRGTHGSVNLDQSGCSSSNSGDDSRFRAASPWNSSFSEQSEGEDAIAELTVTNLPPHEPAVLQDMLLKLFSQHASVLRVSVRAGAEGPLAGVLLRSEWDARLCIARVHKRRLDAQFAGRRLELALGRPSPAPSLDVLRARLRAILLDNHSHMLPLLRLRDAYASRHCCALTTSDIAKVKDTVLIHEGFGRMVQLIDLTPVSSLEMEEAPWKCQMHASLSTGQEDGSRILQPVFMEIEIMERNVKMLLETHGGILPLLSFVECYEAMFPPLVADPAGGVPLELLLRSVPGVEVRDTPSRHLAACDARPANTPPPIHTPHSSGSSCGDRERPRTAPALEPMLALFERELLDLLRTAPRCSIPFSKLIPAFHHHFGRQCRVADYGFTKLPDLLAAMSNTIVVLGSGSSRVITLSASAQARRFTGDLVKALRGAPARAVPPAAVPRLYADVFGHALAPSDYGACTLRELLQRVPPLAVERAHDSLALPRRAPSPADQARALDFAMQTVELLSYTPNLRMELSRFVPAYHAHFGRQLRVAHYGCVKLADLFELIPEWVRVAPEPNGERSVCLASARARPVLARRLRTLGSLALSSLPTIYATHFGALPQPDMLEVEGLEQLVLAAGGCVEEGAVVPPGEARRWASACLAACAALCAARSVARDSSLDRFGGAFWRVAGAAADVARLRAAGVLLAAAADRVRLAPAWRTVWCLARILADGGRAPLSPSQLYVEYSQRYEPIFPGTNNGVEGAREYLYMYSEIFAEAEGGRFTLCDGVVVPRGRDSPPPHEDYSLHDTPPGQKGSRVFESPKHNIWCSPPASALPTPCALLSQEKRRTRLAAQFDAAF